MMEDAMGGFALPVAVADAAFLGNLSDVRKFLSEAAGAVNSRCWDRDNGTLLLSAAVGGQHGLVRFLLNRCATVDLENSVGLTPLQAAACQPGNKETIEMLIEAGANVEAGNPHDGTTALIYAAERGTVDAAQALLSGGGGRFDGGAARGGASALTAAGQHAAARAGQGQEGQG